MKRINLSIILLLLLSQYGFAQKTVSLLSPDGRLTFSLKLSDEYPSYKIMFKKQILIKDSPLGFDFDNGTFGTGLKINKPIYRTGSETYELVVGKTKTVHSQYKEVIIPFEEKNAQGRKINMVVRAFDDGIAFRYEFPKQPNWDSYVMYDENTTFNLVGNPKALTLFLPSYTSSHEGPYTHLNYNDIEENKLMDMPIMLEYPNNIFMSITEAAVVDYAGMYLMKENGMFVGKLSPLPGQTKIKVKADIPHRTPWRVISISDRVGAIIESNILTNLNEPCKIEDTSWLRPGKTTFTWWNGNVVPDTTFAPGNNFDTNKYYIDFAARSGLDYHSIYGYAEQPWYVDDGFDFGTPGPNSDITKPIKPLDMKAICKYAYSQGVGIHLWINWKPLYAKIDEAFALFQEWGISGMMVDFMDRDDQEMIRIQEEILAKAAKHHLFIQFHGSSKPSGLHRTYPNEFTREGTMNYEGYKWGAEINADHDISMPFTRLIAGATDYHLGGFRAVPENKFKVQFTNPLVTSTRCHMLAMYVVLESYLGMVCDTPPSYEGQPGFDFIQKLPTVWDEIKVLNASVNEYITIARRNGDSWYIGSLNNSEARALSVTLDFLDNKEYTADIYTDSKNVDVNPNHLVKLTKKVKKGDVIELPLAASGGSVIRIY
ncbi:glycoside hydrolase family 97 protein [Dysgonomonas sp. ZJ279]|uniref:glycoside hydrolase family 97 protein n=1 Tax=Dysgonomonas sp. ZJ279 TaxID=2709796 RepID=UPI0013EC91E3|nr:glycoside hydrolase family 97 protein [Dysgonomonas sp. ZJ279]